MRRRNPRTADELRALELVRQSDAAIVRALRKSWKESDRAGAQAARGEISWEQADAIRAKANRNYQRRRQAIIDALPADLRAEIEEATGGPLRNPGLRDYLSAGRGAAREVGSSLAQAPSELVGEAQRGLGKLQAGLKEFGARARAAAEREEAKRKCDEPTPEQALKVLARALGVKSNPRRAEGAIVAVEVKDTINGWREIQHRRADRAEFHRWVDKALDQPTPRGEWPVRYHVAGLNDQGEQVADNGGSGGAARSFAADGTFRNPRRNPLGSHGYRRNLGDGPPPPPPLAVRSNRGRRRKNLGDGPPPPPPVGNPSYLFTMPAGGVSSRPTRRNMGEGSFPAPLDRTPRGHYRRNSAGTSDLRTLAVGDTIRLVTASSSADGYGPYTVAARRSGEVDLRHPQGYRHNLVEDLKGLTLLTGRNAERVLDLRRQPSGAHSNPASDHETGALVIDTEVPNGRVRVYDPRPKNRWYNWYVTRADGTEARYALHETTAVSAAYWGSNGRAPKWVLAAAKNAGFDWRSA